MTLAPPWPQKWGGLRGVPWCVPEGQHIGLQSGWPEEFVGRVGLLGSVTGQKRGPQPSPECGPALLHTQVNAFVEAPRQSGLVFPAPTP